MINIGQRGGWLVALLGVLNIVAGLFVLYYPVAGAISLMWMIGAWLFVGAAIEFAMAFSVPSGRGWLILVALVDLALGVLILTMKPAEALVYFGYYVGISLIARGVWAVVFTGELHELENSVP